MVADFSGEFRFGWSGIKAGSARANVTTRGQRVEVEVRGGTTGWVRTLWRLDAFHRCTFLMRGLRSYEFEQVETYVGRTLRTQAYFDGQQARRLRQREPGPPARWKSFWVPEVRDVVSAMFFIRSQPLARGEIVRLPVFPGDSPFLVEVTSRGACQLAGTPALQLDLRLRRIVMERGRPAGLEPHRKFRRATVWISDDAHRLPLRAEVEVFIGKIHGELHELRWAEGGDNLKHAPR